MLGSGLGCKSDGFCGKYVATKGVSICNLPVLCASTTAEHLEYRPARSQWSVATDDFCITSGVVYFKTHLTVRLLNIGGKQHHSYTALHRRFHLQYSSVTVFINISFDLIDKVV